MRNICLSWYQNLYLNFLKFEKSEDEKYLPRNHDFLFFFLQFQKQMVTKSKTNLGSKPLGNHKYIKIAEINTNLQ